MIGVHSQPTDETREHALFYALGSLSSVERSAFEDNLAGGCDVCRAELRSLAQLMGQLALGIIAVAGPDKLRARLLERIATETRAAGRSAPVPAQPPAAGILLNEAGLLIARSVDMVWQALAPGIEFKPLFVDASSQRG